jgi:hypothetical protein
MRVGALMAKPKARKQRTQKLTVTGNRRGEIRYHTAYTAQEAARKATKMARDGWKTTVTSAHSGHVKMTCEPQVRGWADRRRRERNDRVGPHAECKIKPAFKKQIKGLAGI